MQENPGFVARNQGSGSGARGEEGESTGDGILGDRAAESVKIVPYTGLDQEGLLCFCKEGDDAWTRVANVVQTLVNHPHPDVEKD